MFSVLVIGGGPAGLSLAASCSERGLATACLTPAPDAPWPNHYGAWVSDLAPLGLEHAFARTWPRAAVRLDERRSFSLERPYGRIDNAALRSGLRRRLLESGGQLLAGEAASASHTDAGSEVACADGRLLRASLVIDASGFKPALVVPGEGAPAGWQVAWGAEYEVEGHDLPLDAAVFMDFSDAGPGAPDPGCPTFLYAMPLGPRRVFLEETALIANPAPSFEALERRLAARMARMGLRPVGGPEHIERCWIPMGSPLPPVPQRVVGFGAAAALVHPATGYQLGRALRMAPRVADAVKAASPLPPARASQAVWDAIWPSASRASRELFVFGARTLLTMDQRRTREFFAAFFSTPQARWSAYLDADTPPGQVAGAMGRVFLDGGAALRGALLARGVSRDSVHLLRSFARI